MMDVFITELIRRGNLSGNALMQRLQEDGSLLGGDDDLGNYYKCVYPVRLLGHTVKASMLINRMMDLFCRENGDLHNRTGSKTGGNYTSRYCQMYPNYWTILGSAAAGRWDVASRLIRGATHLYYNEEIGSFRHSIETPSSFYDSNSAALALDIYSLAGDADKAQRAYEFLKHLEKNQPNPQRFFYSRTDGHGIVSTDPTDTPLYSMIDKTLPGQAYWFLGMPILALARYYDKTEDVKYLDLAGVYYEHFVSCGEHRLRAPGSGKSMAAAAILYRRTGDRMYERDCRSIAEFFFSMQTEEGVFVPPGQSAESVGSKTFYDIVPEYTRWFYEAASDLSAMR